MSRRSPLFALAGVVVLAAVSIPSVAAAASTDVVCADHQVVSGGTYKYLEVRNGSTCTASHVAATSSAKPAGAVKLPTELNIVHSSVNRLYPGGMAVNILDSTVGDNQFAIMGDSSSLAITHSTVRGSIQGDFLNGGYQYGQVPALTIKESIVGGPVELVGSKSVVLQDSHFGGEPGADAGVYLSSYATVAVQNSTFPFGLEVDGSNSVSMCNLRARHSSNVELGVPIITIFGTPANGHVILGGTATGTCANPTVVVKGFVEIDGNADTAPVLLKHVFHQRQPGMQRQRRGAHARRRHRDRYQIRAVRRLAGSSIFSSSQRASICFSRSIRSVESMPLMALRI